MPPAPVARHGDGLNRRRPPGAGVTSVAGLRMDSLIAAAAHALAAATRSGALNRVALRDDPPALALRGIAMAQLGDLAQRESAAEAGHARLRPERRRSRARAASSPKRRSRSSRATSGPGLDALDARGDARGARRRLNAAHAR